MPKLIHFRMYFETLEGMLYQHKTLLAIHIEVFPVRLHRVQSSYVYDNILKLISEFFFLLGEHFTEVYSGLSTYNKTNNHFKYLG